MKKNLFCVFANAEPTQSFANEHIVVKKGIYRRECDSQNVQRFYCYHCKRYFSSQTNKDNISQHKPRLNEPLRRLLTSGVSKRRCAEILNTTRRTIDRKTLYLGKIAVRKNQEVVKSLGAIQAIVFDEMQTFEHTKCKPLSVPLAVQDKTRLILDFDVVSMPATGHLAAISRAKYGQRKDGRRAALDAMLGRLSTHSKLTCLIKSDKNPLYPCPVSKHFPKAIHETSKGGRGCVVGYGELKKVGYDPLFSLNHTCAMLRDNIACLKRRTWTTTKKPENLKTLIAIYTQSHNEKILMRMKKAVI